MDRGGAVERQENCSGAGGQDTLDVAPPAPDEFEFTLLGPGYGECSLLHLGQGEWIIVDSCVDGSGSPAALVYLKQIGVDADTAVRMVIVTHWHDDHIRGVARVIEACRQAEFVCPAAFRSEEFLTLTAAYADGAMMRQTGIHEMGTALVILQERQTTVRLAAENKLLLRHNGCELWALSPSDPSIVKAMLHLDERMPQPMRSKTALSPPSPNHLSIALLFGLGNTAILLGGDVLRFDDHDRGWLRIVELYAKYGHPVSDVVKVPHHGSAGADCDEMWDVLLRKQPVSALTSFCRGAVALPTDEDIERICRKSADAYATSPRRRRKPARRESAVEKSVAGLLRNRRLRLPTIGRVTLRSTPDQPTQWTAQLAGPAHRMNPDSRDRRETHRA